MTNQGGTAKVGIPIRYEIEVHSGELFKAVIKVPGGTSGKEFVCNFRYELMGTPQEPLPGTYPSGTVLEGSMQVDVLDGSYIQVSVDTNSMLLARYLYDVSATTTATGEISTSNLREFRVVGSLSSGISSVLPPVSSLTQLVNNVVDTAIAAHNADPGAHGGLAAGSQTVTVNPFDLIGRYAVITHALNSPVLDVTVFDADGSLYLPWVNIGSTQVQLDFGELAPITQSYQVLLER